jgi:hypothetical protein
VIQISGHDGQAPSGPQAVASSAPSRWAICGHWGGTGASPLSHLGRVAMVFGAGFYLIRTTVEPGFREVYDYGHYGLSENKVPVFLGIPGNSCVNSWVNCKNLTATLVTKGNDPQMVQHFRLVNYCNLLMMIIAHCCPQTSKIFRDISRP